MWRVIPSIAMRSTALGIRSGPPTKRSGAVRTRMWGAHRLLSHLWKRRMLATRASRIGRVVGPRGRNSGVASTSSWGAQPASLWSPTPSIARLASRTGKAGGRTRKRLGVATARTLVARRPRCSRWPLQSPTIAKLVTEIGKMGGLWRRKFGVARTLVVDASESETTCRSGLCGFSIC